jgi:hypothetical protein
MKNRIASLLKAATVVYQVVASAFAKDHRDGR